MENSLKYGNTRSPYLPPEKPASRLEATVRTETCKKQQLEPDMEQYTGWKLGKEYFKPVYCHPAYLTYVQFIIGNARLDEAQSGIKIVGRNINNLRYVDDTTLMAESRGTKEPLDEGERGEWKKLA